jgi:hypothetical protein
VNPPYRPNSTHSLDNCYTSSGQELR